MDKIFITSALRTPVASLNKSLKNVPAERLGAKVIQESVKKSNIKTWSKFMTIIRIEEIFT